MFWPVVLPFQMTCWLLLLFVVLSTVLAPTVKWKRVSTFVVSLLLGLLGFIPSCVAIGLVIDTQRFGMFHYNSGSEVNDFRVERYLPPKTRDITLYTGGGGHCAKYTISKGDFLSYLDSLWDASGRLSEMPLDQLHAGKPASLSSIAATFADQNWPALNNPIEFESPRQPNGAGATYYFDESTETVYHVAGYW